MKTVDSLTAHMNDVLAVFFTDTHLGANRVANTTPKSRRKLQSKLHETARQCCWQDVPTFFLGDLFDSYSNSESVLLQGLEIIQRCKGVMAGNHDVHADVTAVGSFQALQQVPMHQYDQYCLYRAEFGDTYLGFNGLSQDWMVVMVPHHTDQKLFEQTLQNAVNGFKDSEHRHRVLCLHCNYNLPWDTTDTALNLTEEMAKDLLNHFDYILLGHDHHAKVELDGRLIILGNTHPTGFGDIGDKYRYALLKDGSMVRERIWSKDENYAQVDVSQSFGGVNALEMWEAAACPQFLDLAGEVDAGAVVELNRTISKLWGAGALAIRNRVTIAGASVEVQEAGPVTTLSEQIEADLGDRPDQLALWRDLSGEVA